MYNQHQQVAPRNIVANELGLTDEQIMRAAPSVFATQAWEGVSDKYAFIPTSAVLQQLRQAGLVPVRAMQSTVRIAGKRDFAKHQLRFRRATDIAAYPRVVNGNAHHFYAKGQQPTIPELVIINSHDRTSAYDLSAGLFRFACSNGLIVSSSSLADIRVRHTGDIVGDVLEGSFKVIDEFPVVMEQVEQWQHQMLTAPQQLAFAKAASQLRWGDHAPVQPEALLRIEREDDQRPDVWTTFNRVQEHLIQGGLRGRTKTNKRMSTRAVNSVTEDTKLNKALWTLTQELAKAV